MKQQCSGSVLEQSMLWAAQLSFHSSLRHDWPKSSVCQAASAWRDIESSFCQTFITSE